MCCACAAGSCWLQRKPDTSDTEAYHPIGRYSEDRAIGRCVTIVRFCDALWQGFLEGRSRAGSSGYERSWPLRSVSAPLVPFRHASAPRMRERLHGRHLGYRGIHGRGCSCVARRAGDGCPARARHPVVTTPVRAGAFPRTRQRLALSRRRGLRAIRISDRRSLLHASLPLLFDELTGELQKD